MSQVISLRLRDETADRLRRAARKSGRALNEISNIALEEWLRQNEFAEIEFRSINGERVACLKSALPIWQLVQVARHYAMDAEKTAAHFEWPVARVQAGLNYYEAFPTEIDRALEENDEMTFERLKRILPQTRLVQL
jgi:hypothetical protein